MKYVKYVEHEYMYEQYYSEMEMSSSLLLEKYEALIDHMMSLLCACREKMAEHDMKMTEAMVEEVNKITYQIAVNKTWAIYESLLVINTYLSDFLAHMQFLVFAGEGL